MKDGKGNVYVYLISAHMPLMDAMQNASRKAFTRAFCYYRKNEQQPGGDRGMFLQADDRKVTRTAASIAVAAEHCLNLHAGEFAEQQADGRRSGGKEPTCLR